MEMASRASLILERIVAHSERVSLQPIEWRKLFDEQQAALKGRKSSRKEDVAKKTPIEAAPVQVGSNEPASLSEEHKTAQLSNKNSKHETTKSASQPDDDEVDEVEAFKALNQPYIDLSALEQNKRYKILLFLKEKLLEDVKWCWASPSFFVLAQPPKSTQELLGFYREFIHKNTPCIIRGMDISEWSKDWRWEALVRVRGENNQVRINASPTGRGDAVIPHPRDVSRTVFVKPEERMMDFGAFLQWLIQSSGSHTKTKESEQNEEVLYLSAQNDSLRDEFSDLIREGFAPQSLPLGDLLFGKQADAVNLWIGNELAVSSMHRDTTYENLYCVLRGTKVFHLLPPCCAPWLREIPHPNAQYRFDSRENKWHVDVEEEESGDATSTPWIEIDVADPLKAIQQCPEFHMIADLVQRVEVKAGETLFLPAGWFHRVTQTEPTVAVNYWYDRDFNSTWILTESIEALVETVGQE